MIDFSPAAAAGVWHYKYRRATAMHSRLASSIVVKLIWLATIAIIGHPALADENTMRAATRQNNTPVTNDTDLAELVFVAGLYCQYRRLCASRTREQQRGAEKGVSAIDG